MFEALLVVVFVCSPCLYSWKIAPRLESKWCVCVLYMYTGDPGDTVGYEAGKMMDGYFLLCSCNLWNKRKEG